MVCCLVVFLLVVFCFNCNYSKSVMILYYPFVFNSCISTLQVPGWQLNLPVPLRFNLCLFYADLCQSVFNSKPSVFPLTSGAPA